MFDQELLEGQNFTKELETDKTCFDVLSFFSLSWEISMLELSCSVCRELFNSYKRKKKYTNRRNTFLKKLTNKGLFSITLKSSESKILKTKIKYKV